MSEVVSKLENSYLEGLYEYLWGELSPADTVIHSYPMVFRSSSRLKLAPDVSMESKPNIFVKFNERDGFTISLDMDQAAVWVRRWLTQGVRVFELADPRCFEKLLAWVRSCDV